jgi:inhibitor of cysteine peptidase
VAVRALLVAASVILGLVVAACGGGGSSGSTTTVTQKDSGQAVELAVGDRLAVQLESNPTTGFQWNPAAAPDRAVLTLAGKGYEPSENAEEGLVGAGGTETWTYEAAGAGTTKVELEYYRPFDPGDVAGRFTVTVTVGG